MKILLLSYTQSGQMDEICESFLRPFPSYSIDHVKVKPLKPFPFPWTSGTFFDAMPETVLEEPVELEPLMIPAVDYDLIVLGYQPWFLSPSLPTSSLLRDEEFKKAVKGKPVVSLIGSRNMWINSQLSVNSLVSEAGAKVVANVPFSDKTNNLLSAVTILYWMLSGKKDRFLGIFPKPGVSEDDIAGASGAGEIVLKYAESGAYDGLQEALCEAGFVEVSTNILFIEKRGKMLFRIWARMIKRYGKRASSRRRWISFFKYYLFIALFIVAPIVLLVYNLLFLPFLFPSVKREKQRIKLNTYQ